MAIFGMEKDFFSLIYFATTYPQKVVATLNNKTITNIYIFLFFINSPLSGHKFPYIILSFFCQFVKYNFNIVKKRKKK